MRYQFVEAKERLEREEFLSDLHGFLVPGPKERAESEMKRLLDDEKADLVAISGKKVRASAIDVTTIAIRHETQPKGNGPGSGVPRYAIDGTRVDGCDED